MVTTNKTLGKQLLKAAQYVNRGWCVGTLARDKRGAEVSPLSKKAVRWCAIGALKASGVTNYSKTEHVANTMGFSYVSDLAEWNDNTAKNKQRVISRLRKAAKRLLYG